MHLHYYVKRLGENGGIHTKSEFSTSPSNLLFVQWVSTSSSDASGLLLLQYGWSLTGCWMVRLSLLMWWTMPEMQRGPAKPSRSARKRNVMLRIRGLPNAFLKACQIDAGPRGAVPCGLWGKRKKWVGGANQWLGETHSDGMCMYLTLQCGWISGISGLKSRTSILPISNLKLFRSV